MTKLLQLIFSTGCFVFLVLLSIPFHPAGPASLAAPYVAICIGGNAHLPPNPNATDPNCGGEPFLLTANAILAAAAIVGWGRFVAHAAKSHKKFGPLLVIMVKVSGQWAVTGCGQ